jgi:anti-sigma-K factor RskA
MSEPVNPDIHALSGAYAVDALDDLERARFEAHLADCADCRDEVATVTETAGLLSGLEETAPPAGLRDRVLADIKTVRPLPPVVAPIAGARLVERRRRWPRLVAAAVAVFALGAGGITLWHPWTDDGSNQQVIPVADQVLRAPDRSEQTRMIGAARATLVRSESVGRAVLVTEDLPPAPAGKVYELWLQNPQGTMVPAGLMPAAGDQQVLLDGDANAAVAAGITVEPAGGSDTPSSPPIALYEFEGAA